MSLAILCSGQGPQNAGMFALTGDAPQAADLFTHATALLGGRDPRDLVRSAQPDTLQDNRTGQILCALQPLAAMAALEIPKGEARIVAGYSVGEVAAWGVAGLVAPSVVPALVARRAELMDAASAPGEGLLFVRGLPRATIERLCARHAAAVAIVNPGDAFAVGGAGPSLDAVAEEARSLGAVRVVRIGVKVASHTARLAAVSVSFRRHLDTVVVQRLDPDIRLLSGVDGSPVLDVRTGLDRLADQISQTIQWADCLAACVEAGATAFLELGPGTALADMVMAAYPGIPARSVDHFQTTGGVAAWLSRTAGSG